ncbi:MAG: hypothetical protein KF761_14100 [Salinibacterium sp.]|nr:hypothetical protein [Salinibacterium sp.]
MTDLKLPGDDEKKPAISPARIAVWVIVGGIGLYLVITGLVGVIVKGS